MSIPGSTPFSAPQEILDAWVAALPPEGARSLSDWAIRLRSEPAMEVLRQVLAQRGGDRVVAGELARAHALIPELADAGGLALAAEALNQQGPRGDLALLHAQLLLALGGNTKQAQAALRRSGRSTGSDARWAVRTDLRHPWGHLALGGQSESSAGTLARSVNTGRQNAGTAAWWRAFNEPFALADLEWVGHDPLPAELAGPTPSLFSGLRSITDVSGRADSSSTVTVVVSAYEPDADLFVALRSLTDQSWADLEILVIDDSSPTTPAQFWEQVRGFDERVTVIHAARNGGTYAARNLALQQARGEFITFHDSDDFAHPRRIEAQVATLRARPDLHGCRSGAIRAFADLRLTMVGAEPNRINASSLLLRTQAARQLAGGFDWVRKSADIEYPARIIAAGGLIADIEGAPLAITQLRTDSLSRMDGTPGWLRWTRLAYRNGFEQWHREIAAGAKSAVLPVDAPAQRPFPLPEPTFAAYADPAPIRRASLMVIGDWRAHLPAQAEQWAELASLAALAKTRGEQVAVYLRESPLWPAADRGNPAPLWQELINSGTVALAHPSQEWEVGTALIAQGAAAVLAEPANWQVQRALLARSRAGDEAQALAPVWAAPLLQPEHLQREVATLVGVPAQWISRDGAGMDVASVASLPLVPWCFAPTVAQPRLLRQQRSGAGFTAGHQLPDAGTFAGADAEAIRAAFGSAQVRLAGSAQAIRRLLGELPASWIAYGDHFPAPQRTVLSELDFWVLPAGHGHALVPGAMRAALAAGALPIVPTSAPQPLHEWAVVSDDPARTMRELAADAVAVQQWWQRVSAAAQALGVASYEALTGARPLR